MRGVMHAIEQAGGLDDFLYAYYRGQISAIENYMDPRLELVQQARHLLDEGFERRVRAEADK